jgi:hypothetical protein
MKVRFFAAIPAIAFVPPRKPAWATANSTALDRAVYCCADSGLIEHLRNYVRLAGGVIVAAMAARLCFSDAANCFLSFALAPAGTTFGTNREGEGIEGRLDLLGREDPPLKRRSSERARSSDSTLTNSGERYC